MSRSCKGPCRIFTCCLPPQKHMASRLSSADRTPAALYCRCKLCPANLLHLSRAAHLGSAGTHAAPPAQEAEVSYCACMPYGGIPVPSCRLYCKTNLISLTCVFSFTERIRNARPSRSSGRSSTSIAMPSAAVTCLGGSTTAQLHGGRRKSRLAGRKSVERCKVQAGAADLCHQHVLQRSPRFDQKA